MINKDNTLFVVAMKDEIGEEFKDFNIVLTGVGKVNATYNLTKELIKRKFENNFPKYVLNFGSCGSKKFKKGQLVASNKFIQRDMDATIFDYKLGQTPAENSIPLILEHKKIITDLPYGICGSGDNFATSASTINEVELFDMEAYALAKVCLFENIDFISIKYVTDGIDENRGNDWDKEVLSAPKSFFNYLSKIFN